MSVLVCTGTETPATDGCTAQADLAPVAVNVVGDANVFGAVDPTSFVVVVLAVFGLVHVTGLVSSWINSFRVKL